MCACERNKLEFVSQHRLIHLLTTRHTNVCTNTSLKAVSIVTTHSFPPMKGRVFIRVSSASAHSTISNTCNTSTLQNDPTYWSAWNADVSNSQCRRKQYDSSMQSLQAAYTTSQPRQTPPDSCAGWVMPIPATLCWLCWSDGRVLINFTCRQTSCIIIVVHLLVILH